MKVNLALRLGVGLVAFVFGSCIIAGASIKNVRAGDWRLSVNTADGTVTLGKGARNVIVSAGIFRIAVKSKCQQLQTMIFLEMGLL